MSRSAFFVPGKGFGRQLLIAELNVPVSIVLFNDNAACGK